MIRVALRVSLDFKLRLMLIAFDLIECGSRIVYN